MAFAFRKKKILWKSKWKSVVDNKFFWKTVKLLLSNKVVGKDEVHLMENNEPVKTDIETTVVLNNFIFKYSTESWYFKVFKRRTFSKLY